MSGLRLLSLSVLFISLMVSAAASFPMAKAGCNETCGNGVKIPYPFGIGRRCAFSESYTIYCNGSSPFLRFQILNYSKNVTVLEVSLSAQTITLHFNKSQICQNETYSGWGSLSLTGSPFYYSGERNKLMLLGCGNVRLYQGYSREDQVLSGCTSMCELSNSISGCYGTNCCEANIPFYLTRYTLDFKNLEFSNTTGYTCTSAFLVDQKWNPENYSDLFLPRSKLYFPVVLSWILKSQSDVDTITGCKPKMSYIPVDYTLNITNYRCECDILGNGTWFYGINPYLDGACNYDYLDASSFLS